MQRQVECGDLAVVDDFAPASMLEVFQDGRLRVGAEDSYWELEPGTFCVEGTIFGVDHVVVRHCQDVQRACSERYCLRKCCKDGEALEDSGNCTSSEVFRMSSIPTSYHVEDAIYLPGQLNRSFIKGFAVVFGKECVAGKYLIDPFFELPSEVSENGDLMDHTFTIDVNSYCLDYNTTGSVVVVQCFPEDHTRVPLYITIGMMISSVFLLATLLVYALLPALLNLHGKTLMCHVASLLVAYVCLSCTHLSVTSIFDTGSCIPTAYMLIFSFMAAFSWLNVMCFDIWWTFSTVRCLTHGSRQQREQRRFLYYSLYSWSLATIVALATYVADAVGDLIPYQFQPQIGDQSCFYNPNMDGQKLFFELPVALLTISNIVFFVLTARNCYKVKAELQRLQSKEGERGKKRFEANKNKMITTAKLFVVMGVTWVVEFVASIVSPGNKLWIPADIANSLQGVFIFCIFVLKRKVLRSLGQRLRLKTCLQRSSATNDRANPSGKGYDLWRMRKISSNSTLYTNSTIASPNGVGSSRAK